MVGNNNNNMQQLERPEIQDPWPTWCMPKEWDQDTHGDLRPWLFSSGVSFQHSPATGD